MRGRAKGERGRRDRQTEPQRDREEAHTYPNSNNNARTPFCRSSTSLFIRGSVSFRCCVCTTEPFEACLRSRPSVHEFYECFICVGLIWIGIQKLNKPRVVAAG